MGDSPDKGLTSRIKANWLGQVAAFFTSVRTTVTLLFVLAAASVVGTVIPQQTGLNELSRSASPFLLRLIIILDLNNLFRSWWFIALLTLLAVNLVACLIRRTPPILAEWNPQSVKKTFSFSIDDSMPPDRLKPDLSASVSRLLNASPKETEVERSVTLTWVKHRIHLLGFPLMHSAIILVLLGGLTGLFFGFRGHALIKEGDSASEFSLISSGEIRQLPYQIAVDKFTLTRYPSGQPKEYRSDVRLIVDGKEVAKGPIVVNSPLTWKGVSLYQSDYRVLGVKHVRLALLGPGATNQELVVAPGAPAAAAGTNFRIRLKSLDPGSTAKGPGAEISVEQPGKEPISLQVFGDQSPPAQVDGAEIRFLGYEPLYATGLQVGYDPGSILVWIGCCLLILGFHVSLFMNHRRVSMRFTPVGDGTRLEVWGGCRRQRAAFREAIEKAVRSL
jgi:cytochrome c biogenesis protein